MAVMTRRKPLAVKRSTCVDPPGVRYVQLAHAYGSIEWYQLNGEVAGNVVLAADDISNDACTAVSTLLQDPEEAQDAYVAYLSAVSVHAPHRGHGYGSQLLVRCIASARRAGCTDLVLMAKTGSRGFQRRLESWYIRHGFIVLSSEAGAPPVLWCDLVTTPLPTLGSST